MEAAGEPVVVVGVSKEKVGKLLVSTLLQGNVEAFASTIATHTSVIVSHPAFFSETKWNGYTLLHLALLSKNSRLLAAVCETMANLLDSQRLHEALSARSNLGDSALHIACIVRPPLSADCWRPLALLLKKDSLNSHSLLAMPDARGFSPLHIAALHKIDGRFSLEALNNLLLSQLAILDSVTAFSDSALHLAIACGNVEAAIILCEKGADFEKPNSAGDTPTLLAAKLDRALLLDLFLGKRDGVATGYRSPLKKTLLHICCEHSSLECVRLLVTKYKVSLEELDFYGRTPLFCTVCGDESEKSIEIAKLLVSNGAKTDVADEAQRSIMKIATEGNKFVFCEVLQPNKKPQ